MARKSTSPAKSLCPGDGFVLLGMGVFVWVIKAE